MAKKGSARRQPGPDLEDEELELEAPPRKKSSARTEKPSKSSSVKRKSAEGHATSKKSSVKDSGKRKSASGSNPAASGRRSAGDDDVGGSARRRRAAPPKKKDNTVVLGVSVVSITLLLVVGIVIFNKSRTPVVVRDEQKDFDDFKKYDQEANAAFREFNRAEKEGNAAVASAKRKEALEKWQKAIEILNGILDNHKGPDGFTLPEYEGYEDELSRITQFVVDLEKRGTVH